MIGLIGVCFALWVDAFRSGGPRRFGAAVVVAGLASLALAGAIAWALPVAQPHVQEMVARAYTQGQTGLSNRSQLGDVASLALSRRVVARVWTDRPQLLVAATWGTLDTALPALAAAPIEAIAIDLVRGAVPDASSAVRAGLAGKTLVAGVVDGRNVWRADLEAAVTTLEAVAPHV